MGENLIKILRNNCFQQKFLENISKFHEIVNWAANTRMEKYNGKQ